PTKDGYTFAGWTGTGLSSATMTVTIASGSTGNRTYTATWNYNNPNNVKISPSETSKVYDSGDITLTASFSHANYSSVKYTWYRSKTLGFAISSSTYVQTTSTATFNHDNTVTGARDVGTYYYKVVVEVSDGTSSSSVASGDAVVTITPKTSGNVVITFADSGNSTVNYTYSGNAITPAYTVTVDGISYTGSNNIVGATSGTNGGSYEFTYTITSGNYNGSSGTATWTIDKSIISVYALGAYHPDYTGTKQYVIAEYNGWGGIDSAKAVLGTHYSIVSTNGGAITEVSNGPIYGIDSVLRDENGNVIGTTGYSNLSLEDTTNFELANTKMYINIKKTPVALTIAIKDQTITYGSEISSTPDDIEITSGSLKTAYNDTITSVTLTPSTTNATTNGKITASNIKIQWASQYDGDITSAYDITWISGNLTINKFNLSGANIEDVEDVIYTGNAHNPTPKITATVFGETVELVAGTDFTYSYANNTNQGVATVTATGIGNFTGSISTTFEISTKGILGTAKVTGTATYGNTLTASVSNGVSGATYSYQWQYSTGGSYANVIKNGNESTFVINSENVGINTVVGATFRCVISGTGNFTGSLTSSATSAVSAKALTWATTPTIANKVFNNSNSATISKHGTVSGILSGDSVSLETTNATATFADIHVGNSKQVNVIGYVISGVHAGNYSIGQPTGCTANITALTINFVAVGNYDTHATSKVYLTKVYDGSTSASVTAGTHYNATSNGENATSYFKLTSATYSSAEVGTRNISVTFALNSGVSATDVILSGNPLSINGQITAKEITLDWTYGANYTYTAKSQDSTVKATYKDVSGATANAALTISGTGTSIINAGSYTVTASINSNYTIENPTISIVVKKATPTIVLTETSETYTSTEISYNGLTTITGVADQTQSGNGLTSVSASSLTGTIEYYYSTSANGSYSTSQPVSAGTYYVKAIFTSTSANYNNITLENVEAVKLVISAKTLQAPTNLKWSGSVASWNSVEFAISYTVKLMNGSTEVWSTTQGATSIDFATRFNSASTNWKFTVVANGDENTTSSSASTSETTSVYSIKLTVGTGIESVTLNGSNFSSGNTVYKVTGTSIEISATVKTGYTWNNYTGSETISSQTIETSLTKSYTLTANATLDVYVITYNLNGGAWATGYTTPASYSITSSVITLPTAENITKTGYRFNGWFANSNLTGSAVNTITAGSTGSIELFASWTANSITVTLDANGGNVGANTLTLTYGEKYVGLVNATRDGYTFLGWKAEGINEYITSNSTVTIATNHTSTAEWELNSPVIESANGYTGVYDGQSHEIGTTVNTINGLTYSYKWLKGTTEIQGSSNKLSLTNVSDSGTYYCIVTVTDGEQTKEVKSQALVVEITKLEVSVMAYGNYSTTATNKAYLTKTFDGTNSV
ncbi:MAG: InlB B-repeat-containing protein, partial [Clostridia bacterium]|nr:InlB B-repeat-containing protein [Clostridia bacterium]